MNPYIPPCTPADIVRLCTVMDAATENVETLARLALTLEAEECAGLEESVASQHAHLEAARLLLEEAEEALWKIDGPEDRPDERSE